MSSPTIRNLLWFGAPLLFLGLLGFAAAPWVLPWDSELDKANRTAPATVPRDPFHQPFSSDSVWNRALGDGARYRRIESNGFSVQGGGNLNVNDWTHPVYRASLGDPLVTIDELESGVQRRIHVPRDAQPDRRSDGHLHIVDPSGRTVDEMFQAARRGDDRIEALYAIENDLYGEGIYPEWHGVRAYGGSALGGLIREGELTTGIHHALAVAVRRGAMNSDGPQGEPFVWPASNADSGWQTSYGRIGNLHIGSLLAIPPEVDIESLGLRSRAGLQFARALQDYGAYITDAANANIAFYASPDCETEVPLGLRYDLRRIVEQLQVVTNNTPSTPGGGGKPRQPPAAPLGRGWIEDCRVQISD